MTTAILPSATVGFAAWRSALTLSPGASRQCRDVHRLHQLVLNGFRPPGTVTAETTSRPPHVLYAAARRAPASANPTARRTLAGRPEKILVQSPGHPDWQPLLDAGLITQAKTFPVDYTYRTGDVVLLRLTANPSQRYRSTERRGSLDDADCAAWLSRRLQSHGVQVAPHHIAVTPAHWLTGITSSGQRLQIVGRDFRARGTVHNPELFHQLLTTGLGQGKPYGCGLILTPAQTTRRCV